MTDRIDVVDGLRSNIHVVDAASAPLFSVDECAAILLECGTAAWVDDPGKTARSATRKKSGQLLPGGNHGWIGERIAATVARVNEEIFGFRLVGLEEPIGISAYDASRSGYISAHSDLSAKRSLRKLTFSALLSDPASFDGGELQFLSGPAAAARVQGTITLFPAFLSHEVTPVSRGTRVAIVGWALGPTFV